MTISRKMGSKNITYLKNEFYLDVKKNIITTFVREEVELEVIYQAM